MNATSLNRPVAPGRAASPSDARPTASPSGSQDPAVREMLAEITPLVGAIAGEGPPVILVAGPLVLFGLLLSGPFVLALTLVVVIVVAAAVVVALSVAIVAAPYLLVRRVRRYREEHAFGNDNAAQLVPLRSTRAAA